MGGATFLLTAQSYPLALQTRRRNDVVNSMSLAPATAGMQKLSSDLKKRFPNATHRATEPSDRYNCHGLAFGSRRTSIPLSEVDKILSDDGYEHVPLAEISPGDIVIYRSPTEITHSGIVVGFRDGVPWVLSKWGLMHEVVHAVNDCVYNEAVSYYRLRK
jgi:hypothetical protein